ncbi:MAG TPA: response regulator [Gemmatimonadaceae bacterium]
MGDDRNTASGPVPLVLVIDDVQEQRSALAEFLGMNGFRVATASNGYEGLARAVELRPDVILMDLGMPGMDGLETAKLLKRERVTTDIPIVAVTGQTVMSDERFRAKGFAELISKPCDPLQLAAALRRILGR